MTKRTGDPNPISLIAPSTVSSMAASAASAAALLDEPTLAAVVPVAQVARAVRTADGAIPSPAKIAAQSKRSRPNSSATVRHGVAMSSDDHGSNHQAELFYLQKQIQQQTQMIFILEDGSRIQGIVEWYDRSSIKVRGKSRVLIYKSAIKYLYKAGEVGMAQGV
jgi:sRNA-binding regulator protein Hfq